jgi:hypothetical protein
MWSASCPTSVARSTSRSRPVDSPRNSERNVQVRLSRSLSLQLRAGRFLGHTIRQSGRVVQVLVSRSVPTSALARAQVPSASGACGDITAIRPRVRSWRDQQAV